MPIFQQKFSEQIAIFF